MTDPLEELLGSAPLRTDGCVVCGEEKTARVVVTISELQGHDQRGPRSRSSGRNYCAEHGVKAYGEAVEGLDGDLK